MKDPSLLVPANKNRHFWNQLRLEIEGTLRDAGSQLLWFKGENPRAGLGLQGRHWELFTSDDHNACERVIRKLLREYTGQESLSPMDHIGELLNQQFSLIGEATPDGWPF